MTKIKVGDYVTIEKGTGGCTEYRPNVPYEVLEIRGDRARLRTHLEFTRDGNQCKLPLSALTIAAVALVDLEAQPGAVITYRPEAPPVAYYHVMYTEHCGLKVSSFNSQEARTKFIGEFVVKHLDNRDDFCIEMLFEGAISAVTGGISTETATIQGAA